MDDQAPSPFANQASRSRASSEDEHTMTRVVGFTSSDSSSLEMGPPRELACPLQERPLRQSSLGQLILLANFEAQKPRLPTIHTKATARLRTGTRSSGRLDAPSSSAAPHGTHSTRTVAVQNRSSPNVGNFYQQPAGGTLPSEGGLFRRNNSLSSGALDIPQGLSKAYTAPEPLPELPSPAAALLIASASLHSSPARPSTAQRPSCLGTPRRISPTRRSPTGTLHPLGEDATSAAEAQAEVSTLRDALRQKHEEVLQLRGQLRKLSVEREAMQHMHRRSPSDHGGPVTPSAGPITPDAVEQATQAPGHSPSNGQRDGQREGFPMISAFGGLPAFS